MESNNLKTYCITQKNYDFLRKLSLNVIVGGAYYKNTHFPKKWLNDFVGKNISKKNKNFGTLTSIYWIWKNELKKIRNNQWIGICHYRRFWLKKDHKKKVNLLNLENNILKNINKNNLKYDAFVASPQNLKGYKLMKFLKKGKKNILKNPSILFNSKLHSINLHFDMFHIYNGLNKASNVMSKIERKKFLEYINNETEYFPFSIFILKKKKFDKLCLNTFNWIFKCEKIFDKQKLKNYGQVRLFDFLAERYFSFWIKRNTNYKILPALYIDPANKNKTKFF